MSRTTTPPTFLAIYGYEMTWTKSGANYGHMNTYNTEGFVSRNNPYFNDKTDSKGLINYYELLSTLDGNVFSQFNHPGTTFGNFDEFAHYNPKYDNVINLVEVGNGEGQIGSNGYFRSYDQYTMALDKGWHLSPSNNQDNHKGKWGDANTARNVVLADALTYEGILDAVKNHRFYSTEDKNLTINYTLDGNVMGSKVTNAGSTVKIEAEIVDPDSQDIVGKVEVISNGGKVVASETVNSNQGLVEFEIPNEGTYYYILVTEGDGDMAVTSPVWTQAIKVAEIDSINKNTETEEVGSPIEITSIFRNGTDTDINATKFEYFANGKLLKSFDESKTFPVNSSTEIKHEVTPTEAGTYKIQLKVTTDSGEYTKEIEVNVYPKDIKRTDIADVQKAEEGKQFLIEGRLTSNASGYDKHTAFFDSAYIQDATGGINIFPISGNYQEGQKLRIKGTTSSYQGEHQLNVHSIEVIDEAVQKIAPQTLKTGDVKDNLGLLTKVKGKIQKVEYANGIVESITVDDGSGEIRIFIDGYIGRPNSEDMKMPEIKKGDTVEATGLSSIDPLGNRIRVRNRDDVKLVTDNPTDPTDPTEPERPITPSYPNYPIYFDSNSSKGVNKNTTGTAKKVEPEKSKGFIDVASGDWFKQYVDYVSEHGLMNGITEREFAPQMNTERGMLVTILYRLAGSPSVNGEIKFADVGGNDYFRDAVLWASEKGIVKGLSEDIFAPHKNMTREELVTMIYRYAKIYGIGKEQSVDLQFKDADRISPWAVDAFKFAVANNIINGYEDGTLRPKAEITRAEVAKIITQFAKLR